AASEPGRLQSDRYPLLSTAVVLSNHAPPGTLSLTDLENIGNAVSDHDLALAESLVVPTDLCYMLYTSGSTADPKAVMLQHYATIENSYQIGERQGLTNEDRL